MGGSLAGAIPVQGGVTGPSVSAQICPNGEFAVLEDGAGETTDPFVLHLDTATSPFGTNYRYIAFQDPANSVSGNIEAVMGAAAASPGTYNSLDGACGLLTVCAYLSPTGSGCEDAAAPTCSLGRCYQARGVKSCDRSASASQTAQGSWTLTLTSVAPYVANGVTTLYHTVHGSLTAALVGIAPSVGTATLSVTF
jgi:hypothetical protein